MQTYSPSDATDGGVAISRSPVLRRLCVSASATDTGPLLVSSFSLCPAASNQLSQLWRPRAAHAPDHPLVVEHVVERHALRRVRREHAGDEGQRVAVKLAPRRVVEDGALEVEHVFVGGRVGLVPGRVCRGEMVSAFGPGDDGEGALTAT